MKTFSIFQIDLPRCIRNEVNRLGHEEAAAKYPVYNTYLNVMWSGGSKEFDWKTMHRHYQFVGTIWADDLDECFATGNGYPNNTDSCAKYVRPNHSLSVGDIIEVDGEWYMVDPCGFGRITEAPAMNNAYTLGYLFERR